MIYGDPIIANFNSSSRRTWADLRASTRAGTAAADFPPGTEFPVIFDSTYADTTAIIVDHNKYTPVNPNLTYTTVCQFKKVISSKLSSQYGISSTFDTKIPICFLTSSLTRGVQYYFTAPTISGGWTGGTYKFTPTSNIPASSYLYPVGTNWTNGPLIWQNYSSRTNGTAGMMSSGVGTVDLSTMGILTFETACYQGSSNYRTSLINELLNESAYYYSTQNKYQESLSYSLNGIYGSLNEEIKPYISSVYVPYILNKDDSTALTLATQIFLPSYGELSSAAPTHVDGQLLYYYKDTTDTDRIKYDNYGTARAYWTRTPTDTGYSEFLITSAGAEGSSDMINQGSYNKNYLAPLFVIA